MMHPARVARSLQRHRSTAIAGDGSPALPQEA